MNSNGSVFSKRFNSTDISNILSELESDEEDFNHSDCDEEYIPPLNGITSENSDAEIEGSIEINEECCDSEDSDDCENNAIAISELCGKDGTCWQFSPFSESQTVRKNILRQRAGASQKFKLLSAKDIFKSILSNEICDIILRETNRKGQQITTEYNIKKRNKNQFCALCRKRI